MADSKSGKLVYNNVNSKLETNLKDCNESLATNNSEEVSEPFLLEDYDGSKLPLSLKNVLNYVVKNGTDLDKNDTMAVFIYILMLEAGFVTPDCPNLHEISTYNIHSNFHYRRFLHLTKALPKKWKQDNMYSFKFILAPFLQHLCTIIGIVTADDFVINCSIKGVDDSKLCMLVDPSMYIIRGGTVHISNMYQNLKTLSIKFKNVIPNATKTLILDNYSLRSSSLQGLPPEILLNILKFCDRNTIRSLKWTCRYFEKLCINQSCL